MQNEANFHYYADPEIGVPGGRVHQTKPIDGGPCNAAAYLDPCLRRGDKGEGAWHTNKANLEQPGGRPGAHCTKQTQFRQQQESPRRHRDSSPAFGRNQDLLSPKPALSFGERDAKSAKKAKPYLCSSLCDLCVFARDMIFFPTRTYASLSKKTGNVFQTERCVVRTLRAGAFAGRVVQTKPIPARMRGAGVGQTARSGPRTDCAKRSQFRRSLKWEVWSLKPEGSPAVLLA